MGLWGLVLKNNPEPARGQSLNHGLHLLANEIAGLKQPIHLVFRGTAFAAFERLQNGLRLVGQGRQLGKSHKGRDTLEGVKTPVDRQDVGHPGLGKGQ